MLEEKAEIGLFPQPSVTNGSFIRKAVSTRYWLRRVLHLPYNQLSTYCKRKSDIIALHKTAANLESKHFDRDTVVQIPEFSLILSQ